jgi:transposase
MKREMVPGSVRNGGALLIGLLRCGHCGRKLKVNADPDALIGDKAHDGRHPHPTGITPVIPPKTNRKTQCACDFELYCERNLVERFFNQLKHFRAIATPHDKLARNFLAGV